MYRDTRRARRFSRRVALLGGGKIILLSLLAGRMYQLQVIEADKYKMLSDENRINLRLLAPTRGRIFDRNGRPLAINRANYRVTIVSEQVKDVGATLDALSQIIQLSDYERRRIVREIGRKRSFVPIIVRENLKWRDVSRIEVNALELPGLSIEVGQSRQYPFSYDFSHVLGYVSAVSRREMTGDPVLELSGFKVGKNGIEKVFDTDLRGTAGNSHIEVNAVGRIIREISRKEGKSGDDIHLTIDSDLQKIATQRLQKEKSAAAAVLDIHSGEVLVLSSVPGFDPNKFVTGLSREGWQALVDDPYTPLVNKAISGLYAPGSTFKMVVALAALEARIIQLDHKVFCEGYTEVGNRRFHCWKRHGHGLQGIIDAHQNSCDVFFYDIAKRVGVDRIAAMANTLGLGDKTGIDLPAEKNGVIPTRAWKRALYGKPWQQGETLNSGIGQGFVLTTPLQLAVMTARIANGGMAVKPYLLRRQKEEFVEEEIKYKSLGISKRSLDLVRAGMDRVTNNPRGTAYKARIGDKGMEMSGKTGTAQVRRISEIERGSGILKNEERPWRERDHALFVAYAPSRKPRYAASVVVEHGGAGSKVAAPIVRDLLIETQRRRKAAFRSMLHQSRSTDSNEGD